MKPLQDYPIRISQDVLWGDMDAFEHVNNTVYFRYFEDARIATFNEINVIKYKQERQIGPILANTQCHFKLPLKFPDRIHIGSRIVGLGTKKFTMQYAVYSENFDAIVAEGDGLIVYYDYANNKSCEIPTEVVNLINAL